MLSSPLFLVRAPGGAALLGGEGMGDSYSNLLAHIIFSTKDREALIGAELRERLYAYMGGIAREVGAS
jgi:hypothetical protein